MNEQTIIEKIIDEAHSLTEEATEQLVPDVVEFYSAKINYLAGVAYSKDSGLSVAAFREWSAQELSKGLRTFIFTSQHWRTGRDLNSYLLTCLNRLADKIKADVSGQKKISLPICPACKEFGIREYLSFSDKHLRCSNCEKESDRLISDKKSKTLNAVEESRMRLHTIFATHSRRGWRCPDCERFIPESYLQQYGVSCPYDDCGWFGTKNELDSMAHPLGLGSHVSVPINFVDLPVHGHKPKGMAYLLAPPLAGQFKSGLGVGCEPNVCDQADVNIEFIEKYEYEYKTLCDVINSQIDTLKRTESGRCHQKLMMYHAYQNMIKISPEDMISYLVHMKHVSGSPIQARIFQEYVRLLENSLPFSITRGNKTTEICSLMDPHMKLFWGISEFNAVVQSNGSIPNNTKETYTGGRKLKNFGPCFIGLLIDIINAETGESLMQHVKNYTFVQINTELKTDLPVLVKHFRIASHYEMGNLVILQRTRRKIVDSVYYKLHGTKRIIGKDEEDGGEQEDS